MDPTGFDRFTTTLATAGSRRGVLQLLAALPLGSWLCVRRDADSAAPGRHRPRGTQPEIVGGHPVPQGTYPFLTYYTNSLYACGGSVIPPTFVLTAAHCTGPDEGKGPLFPTALLPDFEGGVAAVKWFKWWGVAREVVDA